MSYTVEPSDAIADRGPILALWRDNLPDASADRYDWLYETNTAAGWLVRSQWGDVVGSAGLMERTMRVFGRTVRAGQAIDLNVAREHRTVAAALGLQRAVTATVQDRQFALLYGFPNSQSEAVLRRSGYKVFGKLQRWAKPLRLGETLRTRLRHRGARGLLAAAANPWLRLKSPETYYWRPAGLRFDVRERFDERFDALWHAGRRQFGIVGERTAAYLTWRFAQCPTASYRVFCLSDARGELLAYIAYHRRQAMVYVGDFFFAEAKHLDHLLAGFLRHIRREGAEAVVAVYLGPAVVAEKLRKLGFWQRPAPGNALVYADARSLDTPPDRVLNQESWYLTQADMDVDS